MRNIIEKYNILNLVNEWKLNEPRILSYIKGSSTENFNDDDSVILGMSIGIFISFVIISMCIVIWAVVIYIKYFNLLPLWVKIIGLIGIFTFPLLTIVVVYIGKGKEKYYYEDQEFEMVPIKRKIKRTITK
jgi:hypothetical protein